MLFFPLIFQGKNFNLNQVLDPGTQDLYLHADHFPIQSQLPGQLNHILCSVLWEPRLLGLLIGTIFCQSGEKFVVIFYVDFLPTYVIEVNYL